MTQDLITKGTDLSIQYINLFESLPGSCILLLNNAPHYTVLAATPAYLKQTGYKKDHIIGMGVFQMSPANPHDPSSTGASDLKASLEKVGLHKVPHQLPLQRYDVAGKDGVFSERYWSVINKPVFSTQGELTYIVHTAEDITAQMKAEKKEEAHNELKQVFIKVKESEAKYSTLFNSMDQAFCIIEMIFDTQQLPIDYLFIETNPVFEKQTGLRGVTGKTIKELVPDLESNWLERYANVARSGESIHFTERSEAMGRWFDVYASKVGDSESYKVALLFTDISDRKKTEEAILLSESNLRNTILQAPVAMGILVGPQFVVEIANDSLYELWGRGKDELEGRPVFEGLPEARDQGFEALLTGVFTTGKRFTAHSIPVTLPRSTGAEVVYVNLLYEAHRAASGVISGVIVVAMDVTEQVISRMKIEENHRELEFIMNVMPQMVWHTQPDGTPSFFNKVYQDYTGLTLAQLTGQNWFASVHPDDIAATNAAWQEALDGESDHYMMEHRIRGREGNYCWFLTRAVPLTNETGATQKWYGTSTNIQEQKENEARFRLMANSLPIVVWTAAPDGGLTFISNQWESDFGNPISESLGTGWGKFVHPDDIKRAAEEWSRSLQSGEDYETEFRVLHQGSEYRWQLVRAIPIRGANGSILQWYGSNTEIQNKKVFEEQLERRVKERTQELEQFTYVSHHDLQEPIRKILLFTDMIKHDGYDKLPEASQVLLNKVSSAAHRMSQALGDVLNFASLSREELFLEVDLEEVLAMVRTDLELAMMEKGVQIRSVALPTLKAVPAQMHQLFYNLINNAIKFSVPNRPPLITINCRVIDSKEVQQHGELDQNRRYYEITVQDNGIGFNQDSADRIFDLFQRLHNRDAYAGTGIGLALCKKVVMTHGGKIWALSKENQGAIFNVVLPTDR